MTIEIAEFRRQFQAIARQAQDLVAGLSDEQLVWRSAPDCWSIAECLNHLDTVGATVLPNLNAAIAEGRVRKIRDDGPYRPGLVARLFIYLMEPPHCMNLKSPPAFVAPPLEDPRRAVQEFFELQEQLARRVTTAEGLDLNRLRVLSPANNMLRLSLGEWFAFLAAHERRHLRQAERVRGSSGFPES